MSAEEVVRAELEAWSSLDVDQIMAHLADDATFWAVGYPTYSGFEEIRRDWERVLKDMTQFHVEIVNLAVNGNVVWAERVDRYIHKAMPREARGVGVFEVAGDKISAWRDYFFYTDGT